MKKIKNSDAYFKISVIRTNVFEDLLSQIIKGHTIDFTKNKYLHRILSLRANKSKLLTLIGTISKKDAEDAFNNSIIQGKEIKKSIFHVLKCEVSLEIIELLEFIYEKILFGTTYWNGLDEGPFSKMLFKRLFFITQKSCTCPYCNSKEDFELLDFEIDHLLPKSDFPLLYLNEFNLIPCCKSCNHNYYGKGNRSNKKYYNLFKNTIGLKIDFEFEPQFSILSKDSVSKDFLSLIQLNHRSKQELVANNISRLKSKVFRDLKRGKSKRTFINMNGPNYFLIKAIYRYYLGT